MTGRTCSRSRDRRECGKMVRVNRAQPSLRLAGCCCENLLFWTQWFSLMSSYPWQREGAKAAGWRNRLCETGGLEHVTVG
jgi:hypothetical protein